MSKLQIKNINRKTLAAIASVFFIFGCSKFEQNNAANTYSTTEVAAVEASFSAINSSLMETEGSFLNATCNASATYRSCALYSGSDIFRATYDWNTCTFDNSRISVSGIWRSYFYHDVAGTCPQTVPNGEQMSRFSSNDPVKYTMQNSDVVEMFTLQYPSFPGQPLGAFGIVTKRIDSNTRELRIDTMEVKRMSAGTVAYDVYLFSGNVDGTQQMSVTGQLSTANRILNGFTYAFFKEQERVKVNFNSVTWSDAACCYPKSGSITMDFSKYDAATPALWPSTGKTARLVFSNTCGQADLIDRDGVTSKYTFSECF